MPPSSSWPSPRPRSLRSSYPAWKRKTSPANRPKDLIGPPTNCTTSSSITWPANGFRPRPDSPPLAPSRPGPTAPIGEWPDLIPRGANGTSTTLEAIARWLRVFLERFFANQFQALGSPQRPEGRLRRVPVTARGDWRAPEPTPPPALGLPNSMPTWPQSPLEPFGWGAAKGPGRKLTKASMPDHGSGANHGQVDPGFPILLRMSPLSNL